MHFDDMQQAKRDVLVCLALSSIVMTSAMAYIHAMDQPASSVKPFVQLRLLLSNQRLERTVDEGQLAMIWVCHCILRSSFSFSLHFFPLN